MKIIHIFWIKTFQDFNIPDLDEKFYGVRAGAAADGSSLQSVLLVKLKLPRLTAAATCITTLDLDWLLDWG